MLGTTEVDLCNNGRERTLTNENDRSRMRFLEMESMQPGNFQRRNKETLFLLSSLRFGYHVSLNKISSHVAEVSSINTLINIKLATSSSQFR